MTREIIIPTTFAREIKKNHKKRETRSVVKRSTVPAKAEVRSAERAGDRAIKTAVKVIEVTVMISVGLGRLFMYLLVSAISALCNAWEVFQEKCGDAVIKMGTDGIFGESNEGYYHTDEGFRLDVSAFEIVSDEKKRK